MEAARSLPAAPPRAFALWSGVVAIALLAEAARITSWISGPVPDVVIGLLAGGIIGNTTSVRAALRPGIAFVLKYVLRAAIVLFGLGLSLQAVVKIGGATVALVAACFGIALVLGVVVAKIFALRGNVGTLIGAGTAICGGSAILAIGPLLRAPDEEIAYALTTIFAFNIVALLSYPPIGHALHLSDVAFGAWTGTAVNDTSVVVATGYTFSHVAGAAATIVKLTRTLFLVPLALGIGVFAGRASSGTLAARVGATVPWFVVFFVIAAALRSLGAVPAPLLTLAAALGSFGIVMVLVAVGLSVDLRKMTALGPRPLIAGFALAITMSLVSFGLIAALHIR
ncbi:MAG: putative sulfate exporter family transporter [Candidatus Eremiobacteraeota bacterium]|nr:putative sulfate exporter family transporter [Candidatus Eremiobacteraeota bacterium]MBC5820883.1 putative sulfate exporter family transporter [Candidatus Eremiobacteraeota bacterium]